MRVAIELLGAEARSDVLELISGDIAELIRNMLLTSRLDASPDIDRRDEVDLLALVAEEGARLGDDVGGSPVIVRGN